MDPERWRQVEQMYHSAAELDHDDREVFLAQACKDDKELQDSVQSLLNEESSTTELLGGSLWKLAEDSLTDSSGSTLPPDLQLGPYHIEAILGAGGMGEVYRARDTRLGRTVAVKMLRARDSIDAMSRVRFQREARAASALNHTNICTVHDIGECDGQPYLVMEYLEGETLRERLSHRPLTLKEFVELGIQIADALDAAHSHGILHRDIKDANVFVTNSHEAKVLDFGIAKVMERTAAANTRSDQPITSPLALLTETGAAIGTVAYMSPEQARGETLDARSDLFSFGVLLYQMATGKLPFQGNTPAIIFDAILNEEPIPVRHLRPELPRKLDKIIQSALAKERGSRIQSAADLRAALQSVKRELESTSAPPVLVRVLSSHRVFLLFAFALVLMVGAATAHLWLPGLFGPKIRSLAVLPLQNASGDVAQEYFAEGMTEALITDLSKISALRVIRGPRKASRDLASELHVDAVVDGSVARSSENVRLSAKLIQASTNRSLWAEDYQREMRDVLALQTEVARAVAGETKVRVTQQEMAALAKPNPVSSKAYEAYLRGRQFLNKQTESEQKKAVEEFRRSTEESPNYAPAYAGLADCYTNLSWLGGFPPLDVLDVAKAAAKKAIQLDPTLAEGHVSLAIIKGFAEWDWPAAEKEFQIAFSLNPGLADAYHWHAHLLEALGRLDEGLSEMRRAHELDPLSPLYDKDLGLAYFYRRDYEQASAQVHKTLEIEPGFWRGHMTMGQIYLQKRMLREAVAEFEQARIISGSNAISSAGLAHAYASSGRVREARELLKDLEDRAKTSYVLPEAIAEIHLALEQDDLALQWLERACLYHAPRFAWLATRDPNYDHLRGDPRFKNLLKRMRLPF